MRSLPPSVSQPCPCRIAFLIEVAKEEALSGLTATVPPAEAISSWLGEVVLKRKDLLMGLLEALIAYHSSLKEPRLAELLVNLGVRYSACSVNPTQEDLRKGLMAR